MSQPVDLTNLRDITGGDVEIEQELFAAFYDSAQGCLQGLQKTCDADDTDEWRKQAHAFKGVSYNLGAQQLGDLCKSAQDDPQMDKATKTQLLQQIAEEYDRVRVYLESLPKA